MLIRSKCQFSLAFPLELHFWAPGCTGARADHAVTIPGNDFEKPRKTQWPHSIRTPSSAGLATLDQTSVWSKCKDGIFRVHNWHISTTALAEATEGQPAGVA
jgi:hypothetical protein